MESLVKLKTTSESWIGSIIMVLNLVKLTRLISLWIKIVIKNLEHWLQNLFFTKKKVVFSLTALTSFEENNRTHIVFSDNGIGIDNAIKHKIFLPFFTTRKDVIGIGLTFSKSTVKHMVAIFFLKKIRAKLILLWFCR
jgi:signal transduction histidine kinase